MRACFGCDLGSLWKTAPLQLLPPFSETSLHLSSCGLIRLLINVWLVLDNDMDDQCSPFLWAKFFMLASLGLIWRFWYWGYWGKEISQFGQFINWSRSSLHLALMIVYLWIWLGHESYAVILNHNNHFHLYFYFSMVVPSPRGYSLTQILAKLRLFFIRFVYIEVLRASTRISLWILMMTFLQCFLLLASIALH